MHVKIVCVISLLSSYFQIMKVVSDSMYVEQLMHNYCLVCLEGVSLSMANNNDQKKCNEGLLYCLKLLLYEFQNLKPSVLFSLRLS